MKLKLTNSIIEEIKSGAQYRFVNNPIDSRERELFLAQCYVKATLDFLVKNGMIEYTEHDKTMPYEPVEE